MGKEACPVIKHACRTAVCWGLEKLLMAQGKLALNPAVLRWQYLWMTRLFSAFKSATTDLILCYNTTKSRQEACSLLGVSWSGVFSSISTPELKKAYHKQAREYHTDRHARVSDDEAEHLNRIFKKLKPAVQLLQDPNDPLYPLDEVDNENKRRFYNLCKKDAQAQAHVWSFRGQSRGVKPRSRLIWLCVRFRGLTRVSPLLLHLFPAALLLVLCKIIFEAPYSLKSPLEKLRVHMILLTWWI
jgi:hypothetical protein